MDENNYNGIGENRSEAETTLNSFNTETIDELAGKLDSCFRNDTSKINKGYPILDWQSK